MNLSTGTWGRGGDTLRVGFKRLRVLTDYITGFIVFFSVIFIWFKRLSVF